MDAFLSLDLLYDVSVLCVVIPEVTTVNGSYANQ